jgi:hypothetical protein
MQKQVSHKNSSYYARVYVHVRIYTHVISTLHYNTEEWKKLQYVGFW